jgi:hypothetical protein
VSVDEKSISFKLVELATLFHVVSPGIFGLPFLAKAAHLAMISLLKAVCWDVGFVHVPKVIPMSS